MDPLWDHNNCHKKIFRLLQLKHDRISTTHFPVKQNGFSPYQLQRNYFSILYQLYLITFKYIGNNS